MHKNTLLFVSFLAVIAALLIGFNLGRATPQLSNTPTQSLTPIPTPRPTLGYVSASTCGITFTYPNSLTPMESSGSGIILIDSEQPDTSIVVVCQEEIPRIALTPDKIETMTIQSSTGSASVSAKLYHDVSGRDGTPLDKLIFVHPKSNLDVFVAGFGPVFQQLIASLKLQ